MSTKSIINTIYNYLKEREVPFSKQKEKYQDGNWTKEEHQRFIESIFIFGFDWKKMTESDCVAELFKMYENIVKDVENEKK